MGEDPTEEEDLPDDKQRDAPNSDESSDSDANPDGSEPDAESGTDGWDADGPTIDEGSVEDDDEPVSDEENAAAQAWGERSKPSHDQTDVAQSETKSTVGNRDPETHDQVDTDADNQDADDQDADEQNDTDEQDADDQDADEQDADEQNDTDEQDADEESAVETAHDPDADTEGAARTDGSHATGEMNVPDSSESGGYDPATPPDDEEMPLTEHIEEMVQRLAVVLFAAALVTLAVFPFASDVIIYMWYDVLPQTDIAAPHVYGPLEHKLTELKLASIAGLAIALPIAVYQTYLFMRPGLYPHERRYYLAAVPTSLVLAIVGMAFAYYLILPGLFEYFLYYSDGAEEMHVAFGLRDTFDLILTMLGLMAVVFQIPLCIMLAIMMGITSREWLTEHRLYFWGAFLGIAFLFSPDPTGMAPLIVAITMVGLFEGTLLLVKWTGR